MWIINLMAIARKQIVFRIKCFNKLKNLDNAKIITKILEK